MAQKTRFTIYDEMEARGVFDKNPANLGAREPDGTSLYRGPVSYPRMLYHPEGERRVTVPGEAVMTPFGPQMLGRQTEVIHRIVGGPEEEAKYVALGWHTHPSAAMRAAGEDNVPESGATEHIENLNAQIAALQQQLRTAGEAIDRENAEGSVLAKAAKPPALNLSRPPGA